MHGVAQSNMPENPTPNCSVFTVYQKFKILNSFIMEMPDWAILPTTGGYAARNILKRLPLGSDVSYNTANYSLGALNACMFD